MRAVAFQHLLRDETKFETAFDRSRRYAADPSDDEVEPLEPHSHPSKMTRMRARHKLDVIIMHLERREFHDWMERGVLQSIHCFSDASPVVGIELQGMILTFVLTTGDIMKRTLPGSQLHYGLCGATAKSVALLRGMFLILGPEKATLRYALSKVASLTTDNGVEVNLIHLPDILDAFYLWMKGTQLEELKQHIVQGSRLLPNAIRLIGMGHAMGGIMYAVCNAYEHWAHINEQLRALVHLFRNLSYREHLAHVLATRCDIRPLAHFEASFVKWRYETIATVVAELLPYETICGHLAEELFQDVQDRQSLLQAIAAARDPQIVEFSTRCRP